MNLATMLPLRIGPGPHIYNNLRNLWIKKVLGHCFNIFSYFQLIFFR